jgi:hypothetical protein
VSRIVRELGLGTPPGRLKAPKPSGLGALNFGNGSAKCLRTCSNKADRQGGTLPKNSTLRIWIERQKQLAVNPVIYDGMSRIPHNGVRCGETPPIGSTSVDIMVNLFWMEKELLVTTLVIM